MVWANVCLTVSRCVNSRVRVCLSKCQTQLTFDENKYGICLAKIVLNELSTGTFV